MSTRSFYLRDNALQCTDRNSVPIYLSHISDSPKPLITYRRDDDRIKRHLRNQYAVLCLDTVPQVRYYEYMNSFSPILRTGKEG